MTKDELDVLWNRALQNAIKDGEQFTRYHFAALVAEKEREACAQVCEELVPDMSRTANDASIWDVATFDCAEAIRARKP